MVRAVVRRQKYIWGLHRLVGHVDIWPGAPKGICAAEGTTTEQVVAKEQLVSGITDSVQRIEPVDTVSSHPNLYILLKDYSL